MQKSYKRYRFLARRRARRIDKYFHRHPLRMFAFAGAAVIVLSALLLSSLGGTHFEPSDTKIVILYNDRKTNTLPTREETVGDFLEKEHVVINEGDVVEPSLDAKIQEDNFRVNVYRAAPVVVYDGDAKLHGVSAALTPRSMAEQTGAKLYPEDLVTAEPSNDVLKDGVIGNKIVIERAIPASLNLYGSQLAVRTHAKTVKDLLKEKNVVLAKDDTVIPALGTVLAPTTQVFVTRNGIQLVTSEIVIDPPTTTVEDRSLSFGTTVTRQAGAPGKKSVTYQITMTNGVETARTVIQEVTVQEPVAKVVARGQAVQIPSDKEGLMRAAGIAESDFPYVYYIINHENASWCPTRYQGTTGCPAYYVEKYPGAESNTSTGYGLCQSTPGNKMATAGDDWRTNAVTQLKWCASYAQRRHGGWQGAYNYWVSHNNW